MRVRLAKQETLTPPGHLVSPLICRGPWMSTVVLYCWCHSDSASVILYFTFYYILYIGCDNESVSSNLIAHLLINKPYIRTLDLYRQKRYTSWFTCIYNSGWAVCFEGVWIGRKFQPLIFEIKKNFSFFLLKNLLKQYLNSILVPRYEWDGNALWSNLDKVKLLGSLIGQLERLQTGTEIHSTLSGKLHPCIKIMNISRKLKWLSWSIHFYFSTLLELSSICKLILVYTIFCNMMLSTNVKYKKKRLVQRYCGTDTSSTVDIHWLLETRGETRCPGCVSVYWLFFQTYHEFSRHSRRRNNWNRKNVILKFSRTWAGHCLVSFNLSDRYHSV